MKVKVSLIIFSCLLISCGGDAPSQDDQLDTGEPIQDQSRRMGQFLLFEGNNCTQDVVGSTDETIPQIINFKQESEFKNDEARSVLLTDIHQGIVLRLFDSPDGDTDDDWVEIRIKEIVSDLCIDSFAQTIENNLFVMVYHEHNGLDGKVSRLEVRNPSDVPVVEIVPTETPTTEPTSLPTPSVTASPTEPPFGASMERAVVSSIIDGDTIQVSIEGTVYKLRYIGMDTPEFGTPFFQESDVANRALVPVGTIVFLEKDQSESDFIGRLLRYVYLEDGTFVNGELVAMGLAVSKAYPPDTLHQDQFDALQVQAQAEQLGLWAPTPTPPPATVTTSTVINVIVDRSCSQFNSPGNDNETKEQEYVCFTNKGSTSLDMSGWKIVDEASHTYFFPSFILNSQASVRVRTGCGSNTSTDLYWCNSGSAIWNNGGDTVYLYDASSNLVTELSYSG